MKIYLAGTTALEERERERVEWILEISIVDLLLDKGK